MTRKRAPPLRLTLPLTSLVFAFLLTEPAVPHEHDHAGNPSEGLGKAHFDNSCSPRVSADIDKGVNLLHSFWYDEARNTFIAVEKREPDCAIAYWGHAMGYYQQVEQLPTGDELTQG